MSELIDVPVMEAWRRVWRQAVVPLASYEGLKALSEALHKDDPRLIQGATTSPPPLQAVQDWPCEAADLIGYMGWQGDGLNTVGEVEEFFARMCFEIDRILGEPAACRWVLNAYDEWPREEMIAKLTPEVDLSLSKKERD